MRCRVAAATATVLAGGTLQVILREPSASGGESYRPSVSLLLPPPPPILLLYAWVRLPQQILRSVLRAGRLDVAKFTSESVGPEQRAADTGHNETACAWLCLGAQWRASERPSHEASCLSYVWQQAPDASTAKCFLVGAELPRGAAEPPPPPLPPLLPLPPTPTPTPTPPLPPLVGCSELPGVSATTAVPTPAPARRFVLVTSAARVGSNWLRSLLKQHPWLHMESELLSLTSYRRQRHNFTFGLRDALDAAWAAAEAAAAVTEAAGMAGGGAGRPTVGWKVGGPEMTTVCNCTPKQLLLEATRRDGAALVFLHREDAASIALSLEIARRSQVFVQRSGRRSSSGGAASTAVGTANDSAAAAGGAANASGPVRLADVSDFVRRVRNFARHVTTFRALLDAQLRPYVAVSYEALYRDPAHEAARVFAHLGLPPCAVNATAAGTTRKLGAASFRQSVANWPELCAALDAAGLRTPLWHRSCAV